MSLDQFHQQQLIDISGVASTTSQSKDLSEIVEENITPRLELVTSITMYYLSYCISN